MEMGSSCEAVSGATGSSDSSLNGLSFGKKIYFEDVGSGSGSGGGGGGGGSSSSSARPLADPPAKKGKGVQQQQLQQQQQQQPPRCQVEGCKLDLTGAKAYYCRHKVCGMHSKSPKVVVAGIEQRFCQQCSRFHQLNEFDQGKRSCRRRLAGHNERRRKPPPGPLSPGYGRLPSSLHEDNCRFRGFLMDFSYPRPPVGPRDAWPTVAGASSNQWQGSTFNAPRSVAVAHQYLQPPAHFPAHELPSSESLGVTDSSCALSLLSNQPWGRAASPRSRAPPVSVSSRLETRPIGQHMTDPNSYIAHNNWGFRGHGAGGSSHEIQHDMEFRHFDNGPEQFSGELELALQGKGQCPAPAPARSYDQSGGYMHWSL